MNTMDVNPPFTDQEKRFVLAEAIKNSNVPVERLLLVFYEPKINPDWPQMLLPHGRNLQSCINTFEQLRSSQPPHHTFHTQTYQVPPPPPPLPPKVTPMKRPASENLDTTTGPEPKRRHSDMSTHPSILPKPSNTSPASGSQSSTQIKKRGRPSKADVAKREEDAIRRGEVIAPPRTSSLRAETPVRVERTSTPLYANIAPMVSPRPMAGPQPMQSPITPAIYDANPSFSTSEGPINRRRRTPASSVSMPGEPTFAVPSPRMGGERSTYPSIISSLTDTIPGAHGGDFSPYRSSLQPPPPTSLPPAILPPSILPPSILPPPPPSLSPSSQPPPPPRTEP